MHQLIKKIKLQNSFSENTSKFIKKFIILKSKSNVSKWVYIMYTLFILTLLITVSLIEKEDIHLYLNKYHTPFLDFTFKYITYLGDGIMFAVLIIYFFFISKKESLKYAISGVLTLIIATITKRLIFIKSARPVEYFGEENLHLIKGVKMAHWHSFPSGHAITVFIISALLITSIKNKKQQIFIVFCALLAGYSRVYLSQHFLIDIFAGSIIGVVLALLVNLIMNKINKK
jgi:membrane-associated phospholipid phosphatase